MTKPTPGPCVWCGEHVTDQRKASGAKDVDWATEDGDYGCDLSPETTSDGVGSHLRPGDPFWQRIPVAFAALELLPDLMGWLNHSDVAYLIRHEKGEAAHYDKLVRKANEIRVKHEGTMP